tara:strand:- start:1016 stop:1759 length:744 start_codon:yes stop_codon:yes gene_type:complete
MNLFQNKKAIITGASRGIGKAIAFNLAENGCDLFLVSRTKSDLEKVRNEILNDYKVNIFCYELDITNFESVKEVFKKIIAEADTIDILINNAGITQDNIIARMTIDQWNRVIQTNLTGYFNCCKHIIRYMIKNKYGRIINISSIIGLNGNIGQINYSAAKAGLLGLTKSLSKEVGSRNITVNSVAPGFIKTAMTQGLDNSNKDKFLEDIALKRFGETEDVAHLVTFLASNKASYITGQTINIDGGIN